MDRARHYVRAKHVCSPICFSHFLGPEFAEIRGRRPWNFMSFETFVRLERDDSRKRGKLFDGFKREVIPAQVSWPNCEKISRESRNAKARREADKLLMKAFR